MVGVTNKGIGIEIIDKLQLGMNNILSRNARQTSEGDNFRVERDPAFLPYPTE